MKKLYLIASIIIVTFVMHPVATVDARAYLLPHSDNSVASKVDFRESSAWDQSILAASATCLTGPVSVTNSSDSGAGSLRQAIADICSSGIINFDSSLSEQTINLASTVVITKNLSIDGSSFAGKISISGNNNIRVFSISSGIIATIDSLIIKNGATTTSNGGGIYNNGGMLTINNSTFISNSAVNNPYLVGNGEGGAVYNNQGELTINRSIFNNNIASRGGAISCMGGTLTVTNSSFNSNSAVSDPLDAGGDAGAIYEPCNSTITKSTFSVNTAAHYGGAILTDNDINSIELTNDTFYGNTAVNGGGIANYGKLVVTHNTFSDNNSSSGGAIRNGIGSTLSLRNSILANSQGSVDCIKSDGAPVVENINNLIETTGTDFESCGSALLTSDPVLGLLADNGGQTQTMALLHGSPMIDAGEDANCPATDQREVTRPQGTHCDIGAYESTVPNTPTFEDVTDNYWSWNFIEQLYSSKITRGCNTTPMQYCPEITVTRAQMAVFLLRGIHGSLYSPPVVAGDTGFRDVAPNYWAAAWIKELAAEGITGGCGNGNYCPEAAVTRDQMAVFLLRSEHGASYNPPDVGSGTGFGDVAANHWTAAWIKQLVIEGITAGCGSSNYCPSTPVSRAQMAVFLVRTFHLP